MDTLAPSGSAHIIPFLRYRDAAAAIDWLCEVFGFRAQRVSARPDGSIAHAQLTFGRGMVMIGSVDDDEYGRVMRQPDEIGGAETQLGYLVVADADQVHARAVRAGAGIVAAIRDERYGGRGFTCRDPGGHLWIVGTHDPWQ